MSITFGELTRGRGEVFLRFRCDSGARLDDLSASVQTIGGNPVPVTLLEAPDKDGFVAAFPYLRVDELLSVQLVDSKGDVIDRSDKRLSSRLAKLTSKINTALRNTKAEAIRNCDRFHRAPGIEAQILAFTPDGDETIVRCQLLVRSRELEELNNQLAIALLDHNGENPVRGEWVSLGDSISKDPDFSDYYLRTALYSARVASEVDEFTCWGISASEQIPDGFNTYEPIWVHGCKAQERAKNTPADQDPRYTDWFLFEHSAKPSEIESQRDHRFSEEPLFSFVVPIYNTPLAYLSDMVRSVLGQSYGKLELILVNASPENSNLATALKDYASADSRIKNVVLDSNRGISLNTAAGVEKALGDFICFLDHDDTIEPDLLFEYATAINKNSETDMLYCDEDKLLNGSFVGPFFKPDWDPELLCSFNYITHLLCVRTSLLRDCAEFSSVFDGAQDHDLSYRIGERARHVHHVSKVLYHWRVHPQSTASGPAAKPYTTEAGIRALQGHLDRMGIVGTAEMRDGLPNTYRINYRIDNHPLVSIIIPNKDAVEMLRRCIKSIEKRSTYTNYEIVVVENNSLKEETFEYYREISNSGSNIRVISIKTEGSFNYSKAVNYGFEHAHGEYIILLNNDTEVVAPNWIERMLGPCMRPEIGAVGARLLYPDGSIQHAGVVIHRDTPAYLGCGRPGDTREYFNLFNVTRSLSAVTGACMMCRSDTYLKTGMLDEEFRVNYNDIDFCLRLRSLGYTVLYEPSAVLIHYESVNCGRSDATERKRLRFRRELSTLMNRWPSYWETGDPYSNKNLRRRPQYNQLNIVDD